MKQFELHQKVTIPEGFIGTIKEEAPDGQFRIAVKGKRDYWYYHEDLEHWPKTATAPADNRAEDVTE